MTAKSQRHPCVESAWQSHREELRRFLLKYSGDRETADDLLQGVYTKALKNAKHFCELDSPRAWLYRVARNQWIDQQRRSKRFVSHEPADIPVGPEATEPVDSLVDCIGRALPNCSTADADIIRRCDLEGVRQADYAERNGLSLAATKARLRRARLRLRERLIQQCGIVFDEQGRVCCHRAHPE